MYSTDDIVVEITFSILIIILVDSVPSAITCCASCSKLDGLVGDGITGDGLTNA